MMEIVFATNNEDKMYEIRKILKGLTIGGEEVRIFSMREKGIDADIVEDGETFVENAAIKAKAVAGMLPGTLVIADDSGLEVDFINREPGIYSSRYMGKDTSYREKNRNIIARLRDAEGEKRSARFVCAAVAVLPDGRQLSTQQTLEGRIAHEERGKNGFGFDPIFLIPPYEHTTAELTDEEKNAISHRGKAMRMIRKLIAEAYTS
ncbi:MAG: RdgB/HAM1 family non-canonical purine NTP pyrophosphatase [Lachnospiraceae bacterium]|nr:RdgB/HAM1 family non-canonical purine NTP pyrophosphatase [Lachnospiraceae bacterium]